MHLYISSLEHVQHWSIKLQTEPSTHNTRLWLICTLRQKVLVQRIILQFHWGVGYLFLWFCPVHGHSYGCHLIAGGEGRKNPFSSVFKYMEKAPKHINYDNACQLSEYCLNREPEFFKHTKFWHALFHSMGHLCGINFKSERILGLAGINSERCEQVNSFLHCIKYTGSHLSQGNFIFFVQFFLHLMNEDKTKMFRSQASIAVVGNI